MGLDMYLHKRQNDIRTKILENLSGEPEYEEVAYWRKDYLIHEWFCDRFEFLENCEEIELDKYDLLDLIEFLKEEKNREEDIEKLNKIIEDTDWDNEKISYYAWW